ncbi:MAG: amidohydrolase, partial [Gemmatimonadetes bacterium]|nr:amidohydrolase [Gemmatimonadota bacterium]NIR80510.1 amidohydrolase [Gemmatimonadota bacterium]NIT89275.1 amidohydrolase [Gemmatimonadota bacterium]NIU33073.1 amidohydrolase [Gemmatimonadota bacterium]NIU37451.1 amidohydrolase [Gemmatimonadota bacterium]
MHGGPVDVAEWYRAREERGAYLNYGTTVGHGSLREAVGATDRYAPATPGQIDEMERLARGALDAGAVGIGFGIMYVPGASREEVFRLFRLAAERGVPAHAHTRYFGGVSADASG